MTGMPHRMTAHPPERRMEMPHTPADPMPSDITAEEAQVDPVTLSRRGFLTAFGLAAAGVLAGCSPEAREAFFQKHFLELTPMDMDAKIRRLRADYAKRFGQDVHISALPAK